MSRTVICRKYKKEMEGLERPPYPGALGQEIFDNVSKQAWQEWTDHQTMLINEKHLNLMDPQSRKYLQEEMQKFLSGEDYDKAEGYVPPSEGK
ncbi:putative Fe(2+)-trafficking protein YggX [Marinobacterium lacunae]|uniref:Probable Fe(2+)-trafficking protein n=1 Tax=Marinobacterium lacunae TaxID=1232683 RepID=A0A081FV88_9GAMM|nr:oxidative damage protection protein [Marinobacterium lacunae]KEA62443.1 putative Fe(2+)-trafficking protein YggX [Marinobacterium lacunae]MBR9882245.1 oxidative damage protection protein [Oceanospirillales bacterium]